MEKFDTSSFGEIEIDRQSSDEFKSAAWALSVFIESLHLAAEQNSELVRLTLKQVEAAERNAFLQGAEIGIRLQKSFSRVQ